LMVSGVAAAVMCSVSWWLSCVTRRPRGCSCGRDPAPPCACSTRSAHAPGSPTSDGMDLTTSVRLTSSGSSAPMVL
jgi:hypothetical protein